MNGLVRWDRKEGGGGREGGRLEERHCCIDRSVYFLAGLVVVLNYRLFRIDQSVVSLVCLLFESARPSVVVVVVWRSCERATSID